MNTISNNINIHNIQPSSSSTPSVQEEEAQLQALLDKIKDALTMWTKCLNAVENLIASAEKSSPKNTKLIAFLESQAKMFQGKIDTLEHASKTAMEDLSDLESGDRRPAVMQMIAQFLEESKNLPFPDETN